MESVRRPSAADCRGTRHFQRQSEDIRRELVVQSNVLFGRLWLSTADKQHDKSGCDDICKLDCAFRAPTTAGTVLSTMS